MVLPMSCLPLSVVFFVVVVVVVATGNTTACVVVAAAFQVLAHHAPDSAPHGFQFIGDPRHDRIGPGPDHLSGGLAASLEKRKGRRNGRRGSLVPAARSSTTTGILRAAVTEGPLVAPGSLPAGPPQVKVPREPGFEEALAVGLAPQVLPVPLASLVRRGKDRLQALRGLPRQKFLGALAKKIEVGLVVVAAVAAGDIARVVLGFLRLRCLPPAADPVALLYRER